MKRGEPTVYIVETERILGNMQNVNSSIVPQQYQQQQRLIDQPSIYNNPNQFMSNTYGGASYNTRNNTNFHQQQPYLRRTTGRVGYNVCTIGI